MKVSQRLRRRDDACRPVADKPINRDNSTAKEITMNYNITICSDTKYEELIAEILFTSGELVVISQERSREQFDVSLYSPQKSIDDVVERPNLLDLDELLAAISKAKERLRLLDVPTE